MPVGFSKKLPVSITIKAFTIGIFVDGIPSINFLT